MDSFVGRAIQICATLVQVVDPVGGRSLFVARDRIVGGEALRLDDRVWIEGRCDDRRGRRLEAGAAVPSR